MAPLSPDAKRLRTIIISLPILVVTSAILYRRTYLGEEQRKIPRDVSESSQSGQGRILGRGGVEIGGAPWEVQGKKPSGSR
ncbi:hypothetical protein TREMEDRAFT_33442 [Tremella mesenterica DSM 1558]|uniref:uncharacterized protein n=1 Tax=Tremella mesenterica (strain ATCC 24925 / CBS 8224 / DSM 1558 / NBRC 9311 / NRRL Y-6157 / RJB 2259-6 / UBC 559-6) TaxID=578456 RepID=UPI0003F48EFF|nr:uncharacterized protein TREMEDRAFT_33442 [Tremella mesenterica DSM 1558]EIW67727.1 hypothetical protein TREMEDRAFT_33442 [Tremella mesenterica DSM 1558]